MTPVRAVALDFGHTIVDERLDILAREPHDEAHLMPGARDALEAITLPMAVWANTRVATAVDVWEWLRRAGLAQRVTWVITSQETGVRKPAAAFFTHALAAMELPPADVLFVGNQRNTDIAGGVNAGIRTVYLSDAAYRSTDDSGGGAEPAFVIATLDDLPDLIEALNDA